MALRQLLPAAIALALLGGCLPPSTTSRRDINDLQLSASQNRKDIAENRKALEQIQKAIADIPKDQSLDAIRQSQTALLGRVTDLHEELRSIVGSVESGLNDARKLSRETSAELDVIKASGGKGGDNLEARINALEIEVALIKKKLALREDAGAAAPKPASDDAKTASPTAPTTGADEAYKAAYEVFKNKKYKKAREDFQAFIKANPEHKWAGNSQFWIGETYYSEGTYDSAILAYDDVLRKYPKHDKVPDSLLKQGMAFQKLGETEPAKGAYTRLITEYPDSQAAGLARKKLKDFK